MFVIYLKTTTGARFYTSIRGVVKPNPTHPNLRVLGMRLGGWMFCHIIGLSPKKDVVSNKQDPSICKPLELLQSGLFFQGLLFKIQFLKETRNDQIKVSWIGSLSGTCPLKQHAILSCLHGRFSTDFVFFSKFRQILVFSYPFLKKTNPPRFPTWSFPQVSLRLLPHCQCIAGIRSKRCHRGPREKTESSGAMVFEAPEAPNLGQRW